MISCVFTSRYGHLNIPVPLEWSKRHDFLMTFPPSVFPYWSITIGVDGGSDG